MSTIILGAGLSGLTIADSLKDDILILEKEDQPGGLCRSFSFKGVPYDIGPHILFSKDQSSLEYLLSLCKTGRLKRSNRIFHKGRFIKYPFENDLGSLPETDRDYCLRTFLDNPHENKSAGNMLEFFLKTFGEGITELYLRPYNEKLWKFDPSLMDMQMVERIPKPPKEDVIKSAKGIPTEGYLHQLHFSYPSKGGIASIIRSITKKSAARIITGVKVFSVLGGPGKWEVRTSEGLFKADRLINCMPIHEFFKVFNPAPDLLSTVKALRYNSIYIAALHVKKHTMGKNFALNLADKNVVFHRLSHVGFLGKAYNPEKGSILLAEITYPPDKCPDPGKTLEKVVEGLAHTGLAERRDILDAEIRDFKYAYVIYDLQHRKNTDTVLDYLRQKGVLLCGRFAEFEYINMDAAAGRSMKLAEVLNAGS